MNVKNKGIALWAFLIFSCLNLATFLIGHVASFVENDLFGAILEYIGLYVLTATDFLTPILAATVVILIYAYKGTLKALLSALLISTAKLFYVFPFYYLEYFDSYGSLDASILSAITVLRDVILMTLGVIASLYIAILVVQRAVKRPYKNTVEYLPELLGERAGTDFLAAPALPFFVVAVLKFIAALITEIVYTVDFFVSYGSDYSAGEILTMLFNYVFLFAMHVLGYLLAIFVKNALTCHSKSDINS